MPGSAPVPGSFGTESGMYDPANVMIVHHVNQALRAHKMFTRDVDYIVKDDKVVIIDEFTGRMMEGRRYSEGLHQALEAKEHVAIQRENQTLASDHLPELFPPVSEIVRHDRHRADRSAGIFRNLRPRSRRNADQCRRYRARTT